MWVSQFMGCIHIIYLYRYIYRINGYIYMYIWQQLYICINCIYCMSYSWKHDFHLSLLWMCICFSTSFLACQFLLLAGSWTMRCHRKQQGFLVSKATPCKWIRRKDVGVTFKKSESLDFWEKVVVSRIF